MLLQQGNGLVDRHCSANRHGARGGLVGLHGHLRNQVDVDEDIVSVSRVVGSASVKVFSDSDGSVSSYQLHPLRGVLGQDCAQLPQADRTNPTDILQGIVEHERLRGIGSDQLLGPSGLGLHDGEAGVALEALDIGGGELLIGAATADLFDVGHFTATSIGRASWLKEFRTLLRRCTHSRTGVGVCGGVRMADWRRFLAEGLKGFQDGLISRTAANIAIEISIDFALRGIYSFGSTSSI